MTTDSGDPEERAAALAFICARAESITGDAQLLVDDLEPAITWSAVSTADTKALMATLDEVVDLGTQFSDKLRSLKIRLRGIRDEQAFDGQSGKRTAAPSLRASSALVALLRSGTDVWNAYRRANPQDYIELLGDADLSRSDLREADLSGVQLAHANLIGANLTGADLSSAHMLGVNLTGATLNEAKLSNTFLCAATLTNASLAGASLQEATLVEANLQGANLVGADLSRAELHLADLSRSNLQGANLSRANLDSANLAGANATDANFDEATLSYTNLCGVKLGTGSHGDPVTISIDVRTLFSCQRVCDPHCPGSVPPQRGLHLRPATPEER